MSARPTIALIVVVTVLVAGVIGYLTWTDRRASSAPEVRSLTPTATPTIRETTPSPAEEPPGTGAAGAVPQRATSAAARIQALFDKLLRGEATAADLAEFRQALLSGDPNETIAAIRAFLASGQDSPTHENFEIAEGGKLSGAPTMRVLLMDLLGQISARTKSDAAAVVGREVLGGKTSADEWAVSMRNVGWGDPSAAPYLAGKLREMLAYQPWRTNPSAGFLEAFDVAVFSKDPSLVPALADMVRGGSTPLQRAATVALDRMSEASPLAVMSYLNNNPGELADRPFLRADYYAKADLSDSAQRSAVETYLARTDVAPAEKAKLLKGLASPASFVSDALLSAPVLQTDSPTREQALATTYESWIKGNRFTELRPQIEQTLQRIGK